MIYKILLLFAAYLIGSIPTSFIIGKLFCDKDIRKFGSGNVGATNAFRVLGKKIGIITLIIDILKGFLAIQLARSLTESPANIFLIGCGSAAILGHIYTIFLKFKGGKGVATSAGVFIALIPLPVGIALLVFIITLIISKYVSLGSIFAAISLTVSELIINISTGFSELEMLFFTLIISVFIIIKHRSNIRRLLNGNENKIILKKKEQPR